MSQESSNVPPDAAGTQLPQLAFRPLTPLLMDDLGAVLRGNFGAGCWCMFPPDRRTDAGTSRFRSLEPSSTRGNDSACRQPPTGSAGFRGR